MSSRTMASSVYSEEKKPSALNSKEFGLALLEMANLEGILEKWRRALALRSDFTLPSFYCLLVKDLAWKKKGGDIDDLFYLMKY